MSNIVVFELEPNKPNISHAATENIRNHNEEITPGKVPNVIFWILS